MTMMSRLSICVMAALFLSVVGRAGDQKPRTIEGWGVVVDPDGDCSIKGDKSKLTITVPNIRHDLNPILATNAPRVLCEVEGNFTATVRVTGDFTPGENSTAPFCSAFNGAGLLLWKDHKNCLRLERNKWWYRNQKLLVCYPPLVEYYNDAQYRDTNPSTTADEFFKGRSTYLRLEREGDMVFASVSHDGKEWTIAKAILVDLPIKMQVGVAAVNSSDTPFTVEFDDFKISTTK